MSSLRAEAKTRPRASANVLFLDTDSAEIYTAFRGQMPGVEALLAQRGLKVA